MENSDREWFREEEEIRHKLEEDFEWVPGYLLEVEDPEALVKELSEVFK